MRKAVVSQGDSEMTNCVRCQVHKANHLVWLSQFLRKKPHSWQMVCELQLAVDQLGDLWDTLVEMCSGQLDK